MRNGSAAKRSRSCLPVRDDSFLFAGIFGSTSSPHRVASLEHSAVSMALRDAPRYPQEISARENADLFLREPLILINFASPFRSCPERECCISRNRNRAFRYRKQIGCDTDRKSPAPVFGFKDRTVLERHLQCVARKQPFFSMFGKCCSSTSPIEQNRFR